jgi:ribonuclease VapC
MIAVDSSAVLALALDEADAEKFVGPLADAPCLIGWPTLLEIYLVLRSRRKTFALETADAWRLAPNVTAIAFDLSLYDEARVAFERFGKGIHPAKLNFGDCMAYAVAKVHDVPLLYKGTNFSQTDIRPALP